MSNLTDLLPAGAGGKQVSFVASGTLGSGVTVGLNSDGTVTAVAENTYTDNSGTPVVVQNYNSQAFSTTYDSDNNKIIVVYTNKVVIGTVSGASISFGTPVNYYGSTTIYGLSVVYITGQNKIVINFGIGSTSHAAVVGTISGTSISFGTVNAYVSAYLSENSITYDPNTDRVVTFCRDLSAYSGTAYVGTISGTSISFGSGVLFSGSGSDPRFLTSGYMPDSQNVYCVYKNGSGYATTIVGTVSGTSITFGSSQSYTTEQVRAGTFLLASAWNPVDNVLGIAFQGQTTNYTKILAATISGTTVTYGSDVTLTMNSWSGLSVAYGSAPNKFIVTAYDSSYNNYGSSYTFTVSGTTPSVGNYLIYESAASYVNSNGQGVTYDANAKKFVTIYRDNGNSNYLTSAVITASFTDTNYADFIGITDAAISDTVSGSVTIKGGISTNVTGLTPNQNYYVQTDGTLSTTASDVLAGKALSSTSINLDYTS